MLSLPDDPATHPDGDSAQAGGPTVTPELEQRYAAAQALYMAGDLRGAILILRECYLSTHAANLLFNIAQIHRELGECADAVDHYQRYIVEAPEGEREGVADARQFLDALRPQCATAAAPAPTRPVSPAPTPAASPVLQTPSESEPRRVNYWTTIGWFTLGAGALATAATIYASIETNHAKRDVENMQASGEIFRARDLTERNDDFYRNRNWAFVLGTAAVATTGFGICALAVVAPNRQANAHALSMMVLPNLASVDYRLRF